MDHEHYSIIKKSHCLSVCLCQCHEWFGTQPTNLLRWNLVWILEQVSNGEMFVVSIIINLENGWMRQMEFLFLDL